jgi:hypothetical protein
VLDGRIFVYLKLYIEYITNTMPDNYRGSLIRQAFLYFVTTSCRLDISPLVVVLPGVQIIQTRSIILVCGIFLDRNICLFSFVTLDVTR